MFEQVDDSTGRLLDVRRDGASALLDLFGGSTTMLGSSNYVRPSCGETLIAEERILSNSYAACRPRSSKLLQKPGKEIPKFPKIRDTIFVHANSSGWKGDLQPFLCLGAGAAGALCLATTVSIASPGFLGRSGRGSTAHTIKLAPAKARMPHS